MGSRVAYVGSAAAPGLACVVVAQLKGMLRLQLTRLPLKHDDKAELIAKQQERAQHRQLQAGEARGPPAAAASAAAANREAAVAATRARLGL